MVMFTLNNQLYLLWFAFYSKILFFRLLFEENYELSGVNFLLCFKEQLTLKHCLMPSATIICVSMTWGLGVQICMPGFNKSWTEVRG